MSDTLETGGADAVAAFGGFLDADDLRPPLDGRPDGDDSGPEAAPVTGDDAGGDDPEPDSGPAIDPPQSWTAEARERFKLLPPELQAVVAERAREQDRAFARRMNEVADQRKAAEAERQATLDERARYARSLETVRQTLAAAAAPQVDWDAMARDDPAGYITALHAEGQRLSRLQAVEAEQVRLQQQAAIDQRQAAGRLLEEQQARLLEAVPEWRDPDRSRTERAALRSYLVDAGYSEAEIAQAADHRAVLLARKAMAWDKLRSGSAATEKRLAGLPPMQRPGAGRQSRGDERIDASMQQLRKTGSHKDAARIFERLI